MLDYTERPIEDLLKEKGVTATLPEKKNMPVVSHNELHMTYQNMPYVAMNTSAISVYSCFVEHGNFTKHCHQNDVNHRFLDVQFWRSTTTTDKGTKRPPMVQSCFSDEIDESFFQSDEIMLYPVAIKEYDGDYPDDRSIFKTHFGIQVLSLPELQTRKIEDEMLGSFAAEEKAGADDQSEIEEGM